MTIPHAISHWFGWNYTHVIETFDGNGYLWEGLECEGCGYVSDRRIAPHCTLTYMNAFFKDKLGSEVEVMPVPELRGYRVRLGEHFCAVAVEDIYKEGLLSMVVEKLSRG